MNNPHLLVGDGKGNVIEIPEVYMAGMNLARPSIPREDELISFNKQLEIVTLPNRVAYGYDPDLEKFVQIREYDGIPVYPVAAVLPSNYLQILRCAFSMILDARRLPKQSFTAVGGLNGDYRVSALKVENTLFKDFDILDLNPFSETFAEMSESALLHISNTANPLINIEIAEDISTREITQFIQTIRTKTVQGIIQINAAFADPGSVKEWCEAGLDSICFSLNSTQKKLYELFHHRSPSQFDDIIESLKIARHFHRRIVLSYGVFPGLTDHPDEIEAFKKLVGDLNIEIVQLHNLEIDPEWYVDELRLMTLNRSQLGIKSWFSDLRKTFPSIQIGYQNKIRETVLQ